MLGLFITQLVTSPLVMDYVKQDSRGKAIALSALGFFFGEVFAIGVLFQISKNRDIPLTDSFTMAAVIIACMGAPLLCIVRNVKIKRKTPRGPFSPTDEYNNPYRPHNDESVVQNS